ncbi:MAG TPA: sulfatase-like hydrolase/transferase, partial [Acidimicrobiales bacterium]
MVGLTGLAVVQPTLDVLGRSPETFVFRRVDGTQLALFAVLVALVPALLLWGAGLLTGFLGARVRAGVHLGTLAGLLVLAVLVTLKSADVLFGAAALAVAVGIAGLGVVLYRRVAVARLFLRYLAVLPVLAVGAFLFTSPASALLSGGEYDIVDDPGTTTPLVVLVLDEFPTAAIIDRDGEVDAARFPHFAALVEESRWYRNYTSVSNFTLDAVPALLSGVAPETDHVPLVADHPNNLFTLLGGTYRFNVSEAITRLCPGELCPSELTAEDHAGLRGITDDTVDVVQELVSLDAFPGPESDFFVEEVTDPDDPTFEHGRDAEVQPTRLRDFLEALVPTEQPGLHYLHLVLPHEPWRFFPDGTEYASPERDPRGDPDGRWTGPWPAHFNRLRFELQARYVDALVGRTVARLQESSLWDDAVIAVVADHGASFQDGQARRVLTEHNAHEIMWSTLFIRAPGLEHGTTDVNMSSTDLLPTLADLMGAKVPWPTEGASILDADDGSAASAAGDKVYYRFSNRWFYEPEAVLQIDGPTNLARLIEDGPRAFSAEDPV